MLSVIDMSCGNQYIVCPMKGVQVNDDVQTQHVLQWHRHDYLGISDSCTRWTWLLYINI
jgi:hypothetical protein